MNETDERSDSSGTRKKKNIQVAVAADHGGFKLKEYLKEKLRDNGYEFVDFGNTLLDQNDDYPDYVVPMARFVTDNESSRGIAVCGSGVGACVAVNKIRGIKACLITDVFSARQGVEDDNMNLICLGGRVVGTSLAWEIVKSFLNAEFTAAERHIRRLAKVEQLESEQTG